MSFIYVALLAAILSGFGTWKVSEWRHDSAEKARIEMEAKERVRKADKIDVASVGHEKDKVEIRTVTKVVTKEIERIVREPFYVAVDAPACFDDAGLHQLAAALGSAPAASEPARAVPELKPAR